MTVPNSRYTIPFTDRHQTAGYVVSGSKEGIMEAQVRPEGGARESYTPPELTVYGTLEEITQLKAEFGEDLAHGSNAIT